jgi:hypothetical protein
MTESKQVLTRLQYETETTQFHTITDERYPCECCGKRIATSFVESAVNQIIDKRMSKSQQLRWSSGPESAFLLSWLATKTVEHTLQPLRLHGTPHLLG